MVASSSASHLSSSRHSRDWLRQQTRPDTGRNAVTARARRYITPYERAGCCIQQHDLALELWRKTFHGDEIIELLAEPKCLASAHCDLESGSLVGAKTALIEVHHGEVVEG